MSLQEERMDEQEIRNWSVAGDDRIVGTLHSRPEHPQGQTVITGPVVRVRFVGEAGSPLALTGSGNAYLLGQPAARFGMHRAQAFVARLSSSTRPADAARLDAAKASSVHRTPAARVPSAVVRSVPAPTLAVTCDSCGAIAVATLAQEVRSVNAAGGIRIDDPCLECGGRLAAQPGKYLLNAATEVLERVGDFEPHSAPGASGRGAGA
jgi:hypothetical protein